MLTRETMNEQDRRAMRAATAIHRRRLGIKHDEPPDIIGELLYRISRLEREVAELKKQNR